MKTMRRQYIAGEMLKNHQMAPCRQMEIMVR